MEIKEGMYVRTTDGIIEKVIKIGEIRYMHEECYQTDRKETLYREDIKKASFNIIDLIEVGDIVKWKTKYNGGINEVIDRFGEVGVYAIEEDCCNLLEDIEILEVVTHEQFDSMKYEVK